MQNPYTRRVPIPRHLVFTADQFGPCNGQEGEVAQALNALLSERLLDRFRVSWNPMADYGVTPIGNPFAPMLPLLLREDLGMSLDDILAAPDRFLPERLVPCLRARHSGAQLPTAA